MTLAAAGELGSAAPSLYCSTALPGTPAAAALAAAAAAEAVQVGAADKAGGKCTEQQPAGAASPGSAAEGTQAAPSGVGNPPGNEQEAADEGGTSPEGPEFIAESGYRGLK